MMANKEFFKYGPVMEFPILIKWASPVLFKKLLGGIFIFFLQI